MSARIRPHSTEWYHRLSTLQAGYYFPWQSTIAPGNGEDAYIALVNDHLSEHLGRDVDMLDVACGHGALTLQFAARCRSVTAYDLLPSYIEMAQRAAAEQGIHNARFVCHDSSYAANNGRAYIPFEDNSFDLMVCRRGPFHWVEEARRLARPGAAMIMLIPDTLPIPEWHDMLPEPLQWSVGTDPNWARNAMEPRLLKSGIPLHSWWSFDVPQYFIEPEQLYIMLVWGHTPDEKPPYAEVAPQLEAIFAQYSTADGIALRHRRSLWKAIVTK
jgi:23S rRNA (guanine745-N1)-methyltransferase